jgi:hypothetical protein
MRQPISAHYCGYCVTTSIETDAARAVPRIRQATPAEFWLMPRALRACGTSERVQRPASLWRRGGELAATLTKFGLRFSHPALPPSVIGADAPRHETVG